MLTSTKVEMTSNVDLFRVGCEYLVEDESYLVKKKRFGHQYAPIYLARLSYLRPIVSEQAKKKWGEQVPHVHQVLDVKMGVTCVAVGTIYANMPLKPNILNEVTQERYLLPPPPREKYISDEDDYVLEDEFGRVKLVGDQLKREILVTGIVVAVLGTETKGGDFQVQDYCFAGFPPSTKPLPCLQDDMYIAMISGLNIEKEPPKTHVLQRILTFLAGETGTDQDLHISSRICRLIIAGNSIWDVPKNPDDYGSKKSNLELVNRTTESLNEFDQWLEQVCSVIDVDLMPGDHDPTTYFLPQQPLLRSILPLSNPQTSSLNMVPNPHACSINGVSVLGTSGQPIQDIFRFVSCEDRLKLMEETLKWRHIAPTAPDTLPCYPFVETDPFLLNHLPHIYFSGNAPTFETKLIQHYGSRQFTYSRMSSTPVYRITMTPIPKRTI